MAHRVLMSVLVGVVIVGFASLWATPAATQTAVPRTSWGDPDISGIWTTDAEHYVPFERPVEFGERQFLTEEELAKRAGQADARIRDNKEDRSARGALGTPAHWFEVGGGVSARTSFVASDRIDEPFTWALDRGAIRLGVNYVGLYDEVSLFSRALTDEEVRALHALEDGVAGLYR